MGGGRGRVNKLLSTFLFDVTQSLIHKKVELNCAKYKAINYMVYLKHAKNLNHMSTNTAFFSIHVSFQVSTLN